MASIVLSTGTFAVQSLWSNAFNDDAGDCVMSYDGSGEIDTTPPSVTGPVPSVRVPSKLGSGSTQISWTGSTICPASTLRATGVVERWAMEERRTAIGYKHQLEAGLPLTPTCSFVSAPPTTRETGAPTDKAIVHSRPVRGQEPCITYSAGWTRAADSHASGGTRTYSIKAGARVSLTSRAAPSPSLPF